MTGFFGIELRRSRSPDSTTGRCILGNGTKAARWLAPLYPGVHRSGCIGNREL